MRRTVLKFYLKNKTVHFSSQELLIESSGRFVFIYKKGGKFKLKLPFCFPRDFHFNIPLLKRLLRSNAMEIIYDEITEKILVIRNSTVYLIKGSEYLLLGKIDGDSPLFNSHCISNGIIYFGEYSQNKSRMSSKIYKIDNDNLISVAHTFSPMEIRHVHSVIKDPYLENRIWVTTGDNDGECLLLYTDDDFKNIFNLGDKSQDYRIVNLGFSKECLFYGTDSLIKPNFIIKHNKFNGKREKVLSIKQTAWFLKQDKFGNAILGTTVENGKGCQVNHSSIYISEDFGDSWFELLRIPKDFYPMPLFKWGSVSFSNGFNKIEALYINVEGLKYLSGKSFNLGYILNFSENDLKRIEVEKKDYFSSINHLMLVIFRVFSIYKNSQDLRFLNLLLKLIDWMPLLYFKEKTELKSKALNIYESINNSSN